MTSFAILLCVASVGLASLGVATSQLTSCPPDTWHKLAPLPSVRQEHGTVAMENTLIAVVGGVTNVNGSLQTTNLLDVYDISSNTWKSVTPSPIKINHPNVVSSGERIYLLGGLIDGPQLPGSVVNWIATGQSYVYNLKTDIWTQLESMPPGTERGSAAAAMHGEMIYLAGGMTILQDQYQDSLTTVTAFNVTSGKWQRVPAAAANIPEGRQHLVGAIIEDDFYLLGGRWYSQMNVRGTVFKLSLSNLESGWSTFAEQMPVPRGGLCGGAVGGKLYGFGGEGCVNTVTGVFNQSEAFGVLNYSWSELAPMEIPRHGTSAAVAQGRIYIPGGGLQQEGKQVVINGVLHLVHPTAYFDAYCV